MANGTTLTKTAKATRRSHANGEKIMAESTIEKVTETVFDLDTKADVTLIKEVQFKPVENMQEFVAQLGNDSAKILSIVNDGLRVHVREQAKSDSSIPWMQESEDGKLEPFTGTPLTGEASKKLAASVLSFAKLLFGYETSAKPEIKSAAKKAALDQILSNPAAIEKLKAQS